MRFDGPLTHMKLPGDLRVGESGRHEFRHPRLSGRQALRRLGAPQADPAQLVTSPRYPDLRAERLEDRAGLGRASRGPRPCASRAAGSRPSRAACDHARMADDTGRAPQARIHPPRAPRQGRHGRRTGARHSARRGRARCRSRRRSRGHAARRRRRRASSSLPSAISASTSYDHTRAFPAGPRPLH